MSCFRVVFFLTVAFSSFVCSAECDCVYLASFPRSGNHWVRFLIEEATHIATSSVYRDNDYHHLPEKFPWGGYSTDHGYNGNCRYPTEKEAVVLKTHYPYFPGIPKLNARLTICLIRHPIDAFYSFHVYKQSRINSHRTLTQTLPKLIMKWKLFYEYWDQQPGVLLIRYEDLYQSPATYLTKMLEAIGYQVQSGDVLRAVDKYPPKGGVLKQIERYSASEIELINRELKDLLLKYGYL